MGTVHPIDRIHHFHRLTVEVAGEPEPFLLDTGIGITVVSPDLAVRHGFEHTGESYAGRRMSGQLVEAPLVRLPELRIGDLVVEPQTACVIDLGGGADFAGILTPAVFGDRAFTLDPALGTLELGDPGAPLPDGVVVDLHTHRDGPAVDWSVDLVLPSGRTVRVEVDTGSAALILDTSYLVDCGLSLDDPSLDVGTGTDETGYEWTRRWAEVRGSVHLADAPETAMERPRAMFQDIVLDGLVGTDYLDRFVTTYDLGGESLVLSRLGSGG